MLTLVCTGFAICIAMLSALLWLLITRRGAPLVQPQRHSRWRWLLRWPVGPLARWLAPRIPERWRVITRGALERADLDEYLGPEEWLATLLLAATGMAGGCYLWSGSTGLGLALRVGLAAATGVAAPYIALRDRMVKRQRLVLRELPSYLDLLTLALEAGCAFGAALQLAVKRSTASPLRTALERSLQEVRAGGSRAQALRRLERRLGVAALSAAVSAIVQAEATGVSLAPVMRAQALRGTQERFARAEKLAMEAPVKMLAPLVFCIFPCTFIVIGFPIAVRLFWGM